MKVEYIREITKEKCTLHSENKTFLMGVEQREVNLSFNKKKYIKFKIKLTIQNSSFIFPFEANIIDYLKDGQFLSKKGFIYALYCFIGKAFWYSKFGLVSNSEVSNLNKFLQDNNIFDNQDLNFDEERVYNECKTAYQFLKNKCNFTESFLAVFPAIIEDYLIEYYNDYYF